MAMSPIVEKSKMYPSLDAFRADEADMRRNGWNASATRTRRIQFGWLKRALLRRPQRTEVEALYTRSTWPARDIG